MNSNVEQAPVRTKWRCWYDGMVVLRIEFMNKGLTQVPFLGLRVMLHPGYFRLITQGTKDQNSSSPFCQHPS